MLHLVCCSLNQSQSSWAAQNPWYCDCSSVKQCQWETRLSLPAGHIWWVRLVWNKHICKNHTMPTFYSAEWAKCWMWCKSCTLISSKVHHRIISCFGPWLARSPCINFLTQSVYLDFPCLSNFFCWATIMPSVQEKKKTVRHLKHSALGGESHHWCDSQVLKARYSNPPGTAPLSSERGRSHSREGQPSSLRQTVQSEAVFSAQIHITVTMLGPNNVLLSKISAEVLKVSWLCPRRTSQRARGDEKMTEYQGSTAQLGVSYTVCTHQRRSHTCLSTNPAVSWQARINRAGMQDTSPRGEGPWRGRWVHRAAESSSARASQLCTDCCTDTFCLDTFHSLNHPPVVQLRVAH